MDVTISFPVWNNLTVYKISAFDTLFYTNIQFSTFVYPILPQNCSPDGPNFETAKIDVTIKIFTWNNLSVQSFSFWQTFLAGKAIYDTFDT